MRPATLSTPVRVDWDGPWTDPALTQQIVAHLLEAGVFFVTLDAGYLGLPALGLRPLFERAHVTVRVPAASLDALAVRELLVLPPAVVLLEAESAAELAAVAGHVTQLGRAGARTGIACVPCPSNVAALVPLVDAAAALGVDEVHLPNPNVVDPARRARYLAPLTRAQHAALARAVEARIHDWRRTLAFHVHDFFLWPLFHPVPGADERAEQGGCQAGAARAYVAASGEVYACTAMPVALGDLRRSTLREIYERPSRVRLRERVERLDDDAGCGGCARLAACRGGCRGLAWVVRGDFDGPDVLCEALEAREAMR